jgi:hypothetical protein
MVDRIDTGDLGKIGLLLLFTNSAWRFLESIGLFEWLRDSVGGSYSAAWLIMMIITAGILWVYY